MNNFSRSVSGTSSTFVYLFIIVWLKFIHLRWAHIGIKVGIDASIAGTPSFTSGSAVLEYLKVMTITCHSFWSILVLHSPLVLPLIKLSISSTFHPLLPFWLHRPNGWQNLFSFIHLKIIFGTNVLPSIYRLLMCVRVLLKCFIFSFSVCSATLSFVIILICVMCYCFNRSINKNSMALYRQRIMQSMNEHNVDIYTVEQVMNLFRIWCILRACCIDKNVTLI